MTADDSLREGQLLGSYRLGRQIGSGGMGTVFEATHLRLNKAVAIKILSKAHAATPAAVARFTREGQVASLIDHPNVVSVTDFGTENGVPFLVMELLKGRSLADGLESRQRESLPQALNIILPVVSAVLTLHDHGVVHRDLKPGNIFLKETPAGEVIPKVLDFGVSKLVGDLNPNLAATGILDILGTVSYMSPEQARGAAGVDHRTDQYSIALILLEMLAGQPARHGGSSLQGLENARLGRIEPLAQLRADLPRDLIAVVERALSPSPADRFADLAAFGTALLPFASERTRETMTRAFTNRTRAPVRRPTNDETIMPGAVAPSSSAPSSSAGSSSAAAWPAGGTLMLPPDQAPPPSTFAHSVSAIDDDARPAPGGPPIKRLLVVGGTLALGAAVLLLLMKPKEPTPAPPPVERTTAAPTTVPAGVRHLVLRARPAGAELVLDGGPPARDVLETDVPATGRHQVRISLPGYEPKVLSFDETNPTLPDAVTLAPLAPDAPPPSAEKPTSPPPEPHPTQKPSTGPHHRTPKPGGKPQLGAHDAPIID